MNKDQGWIVCAANKKIDMVRSIRHPIAPADLDLMPAALSYNIAPIEPLAGGHLSSTAVPPTAPIEASLLRLDRRHAAEDCHDIRHRISAESDKHLIRRLS
jgi:hypothetical protein